MSGRPTLGPHENFPDAFIRRESRKDVASTSRPRRTYELRFTDAGTKKDARKTFKWAKSGLFSQRRVRMRRPIKYLCRVGYNIQTYLIKIRFTYLLNFEYQY